MIDADPAAAGAPDHEGAAAPAQATAIAAADAAAAAYSARRECSCSAAGLATAFPYLPSSLEKTLADPASIREMPPGLHFLEIPQPSRKFHTAVLIVTWIATNAPRAFAAMQQV